MTGYCADCGNQMCVCGALSSGAGTGAPDDGRTTQQFGETPVSSSHSVAAPCSECGHPQVGHYAIKNAPPTGVGHCGEHTGCEACDAERVDA